MSLRAHSALPVEGVSMQRDQYIAASVHVEPEDDPVLIVTWGSDANGWLEIVVGRHQGNLQSLTVLTPPRESGVGPRLGEVAETRETLPVLSVDGSDRVGGSGRAGSEDLTLTIPGSLVAGMRGDDWVLLLGGEPVTTRYVAHGLEIGSSRSGLLTEIVLTSSLLDRATGF